MMKRVAASLGGTLPLLFCLNFGLAAPARAGTGTYFEVGTGIGRISGGDSYFQKGLENKTGFSGSLSLYTPITREARWAHLDFGLNLRMTSATSLSGESLGFGSANLGLRAEIWRFYVGGGYSPIAFVSNKDSGLIGLHTYPSNSSYFCEGGAIWRVIPELQILAAASLEYGAGKVGRSPSPLFEYGLRFRFPLNPKEGGSSSGVDFDGFRYPFGVMK